MNIFLRFTLFGIRKICSQPAVSVVFSVRNVHRLSSFRSFSRSNSLLSSAEEKFEEIMLSKDKSKPTRKRRGVADRANYSMQRQRLPQVVSFSLAEAFDLHSISHDNAITNIYNVSYLDDEFEDALYIVKKVEYTLNPTKLSEIFIFEDGAVVFWNVDSSTRAHLMRDLERYTDSPYESKFAHGEMDTMPFTYTKEDRSRIKSDSFVLSENKHLDPRGCFDGILERYAFSHAFAASAKVGVWETLLNNLSEPLAETTKTLKQGKIPWNRREALRRAGEFAALRHSINLNCQLLNKDFYWERADLEEFYDITSRHLILERRLKSLNDRLDYCEELVRMVDNMLALRHASTLEWIIILLIVIEVFFDITHFVNGFPKQVVVPITSLEKNTTTSETDTH